MENDNINNNDKKYVSIILLCDYIFSWHSYAFNP